MTGGEGNDAVLAVFLAANSQVEARYRLPSPLVLTPVAAGPGQIGLSFNSEPGMTYVLEQSSSLIASNWTAMETRSGDGSTIQIMRPVGTAPKAFFRLRQGQ